ncbi:MAG TPA: PadR family transcriptional regulator [Gemmatimonadaceae bacterium]
MNAKAGELEILLGTLDVLVLRTLTWGPRHGYAIAQWLRDTSDGQFRILDGALYTALHRLEEQGLVESEWGLSEKGKRAKFYRITPAGRRHLRAAAAKWDRYVAAMTKVMTATAWS